MRVGNPPQKDEFFDAKTRRFFTPPPFTDSERSLRILAPEGEGTILLSSDTATLFFDTSNDVTLSTCEFAIRNICPRNASHLGWNTSATTMHGRAP